jgi:hypothetical protein
MKKIIVFLFFSMVSFNHAQNIKKTKFVVMPGDNWMSQNGYIKTLDNQGVSTDVYDYAKAMRDNFEMKTAVETIESTLRERGLQVENLSEKMKSITKSNAEQMVNTSKTGASTTQNAFDKFMNTVRPDILVLVDYQIVSSGPKKIMNIRITSNDAYTFRTIGSKPGSSAPTFSIDINTLVRESIASIIDPFMNDVENHVNDIFENGREVMVELKKFDAWDGDFEKEYDGKEMKEIFENWFRDIAVKNDYTVDSPSESYMSFLIRIPLTDEEGKATNATTYGRKFQKFIKQAPFSIISKVREIGIGRCMVILGEK